MKDLFVGGLALLVIGVLFFGVFILGGWAISALINVVLGQLGLGTITTFAGCCLIGAFSVMYHIAK